MLRVAMPSREAKHPGCRQLESAPSERRFFRPPESGVDYLDPKRTDRDSEGSR
jgi:hypothetical protein